VKVWDFLESDLKKNRNRKNAPVISKEKKSVAVRVIHTDEEWMIAKTVNEMINNT
jgi:acetate kinase